MRLRALGAVLVAGVVALAQPAWSQPRGGWHGGAHGSTERSAYGWHGGQGWHWSGGHWPGGYHGGFAFHGWRGGFGWPTFWAWDAFWFGLPLWWDAYWGWNWPYWYYPYYSYYGYPDAGIAFVPSAPDAPAPGFAGAAAAPTERAMPAGPAPVDLEVSPPSALVFLNGILIGSADEFAGRPDYLYLDPGQFSLQFRSPGYRTKTVQLDPAGGNKIVVALDLNAEPGVGGVPASPPSPGLPHGRRFGPAFGRDVTPPQASAGGALAAPASAVPTAGGTALLLRVSPPEAAVYVDGALLGTGETLARLQQGVAVAPGTHRVDVVAPGRAGKTVQVEAEAGKAKELLITLD